MTRTATAKELSARLSAIQNAARAARETEAAERKALARDVGASLRDLRVTLGASAAEQARALGLDVGTYMEHEDGHGSNESGTIQYLARLEPLLVKHLRKHDAEGGDA